MTAKVNSPEPLVSIFTPAYNTEKYLRECIESVLEQTYTNWEYLIVNNCSTDNTLKIAEEYAGKDKRIRIHDNKDFLNQMQNWNHGLRLINPNSEYCKIIHGDDWLYPECIEKMVAVAEKSHRIGMVSSYRLDESKVKYCNLPPGETIFSGREICRQHFLNGLWVFGSPSTLLIRTDVIKQLDPFYDEKNVHADTDVCFRILKDWDLGFVHQILSYTRRHNESSLSLANNFNTRNIFSVKSFKTYGPDYLNSHEFKKREKRIIFNYYRFLARSFFEFKDMAYWKYHRDELRKMGISINWMKLSVFILLQLADLGDTYRLIRDNFKNNNGHESSDIRKNNLSKIYSNE